MALITLVCERCGHVQEELVTADAPYPACEKCGGGTKQCFSGKCYGSIGGVTGGGSTCSHNCSTCKGCGK